MSLDILLKNVCGYLCHLTELLHGKQIHDREAEVASKFMTRTCFSFQRSNRFEFVVSVFVRLVWVVWRCGPQLLVFL